MAGICRGGQILNVFAGGSMWQDISGHKLGTFGRHSAICQISGEVYDVTSCHHQMMRPTSEGEIVLTSQCSSYKTRMVDVKETSIFNRHAVDIEAVFYKKENLFCFQPHPEFYGEKKLANIYFDFIDFFLFK